jgi:hypothetical protein
MYPFGCYMSFARQFNSIKTSTIHRYIYCIILSSPVGMFYQVCRVPEVRFVLSFLLIVVSAILLCVSSHDDNSFLVMFYRAMKDTDPCFFYSSNDL